MTTPIDPGSDWQQPRSGTSLPGTALSDYSPGFFARLFDVSFREFVTPSIVSILYVLWLVYVGLISLLVLIVGTRAGLNSVVVLILAPIVFLFGAIWGRLILETVMVLFRIESNTRTRKF